MYLRARTTEIRHSTRKSSHDRASFHLTLTLCSSLTHRSLFCSPHLISSNLPLATTSLTRATACHSIDPSNHGMVIGQESMADHSF